MVDEGGGSFSSCSAWYSETLFFFVHVAQIFSFVCIGVVAHVSMGKTRPNAMVQSQA